MLPNNTLHRGKSQPGALAHFLGGEEGIKNTADHVPRDAATAVRDGQADELAGNRIWTSLDVGWGNNLEMGADGNGATFRHGVACVQGKIDEDLFHTTITE